MDDILLYLRSKFEESHPAVNALRKIRRSVRGSTAQASAAAAESSKRAIGKKKTARDVKDKDKGKSKPKAHTKMTHSSTVAAEPTSAPPAKEATPKKKKSKSSSLKM